MRVDLKVSVQRVRALLEYDPETGVLRWKVSHGNSAKAGDIAGSLSKAHGYRIIGIDYLWQRAHRIAWLHYYGEHAPTTIDHVNGNRADNRISNLRAAPHASNLHNRGAQKNNTSGFKGVSFIKDSGKWDARITCHGKQHCLGHYLSAEAAHQAYCEAAHRLHGEFARTE